MRTAHDLIGQNWSNILIPGAVFMVSLTALFWLRKLTLDWLGKWSKNINWSLGNTLIPSLRGPFSLLCLILSAYLGLQVSGIPESWKIPAGNSLWTLFIIAVTLTVLNLAGAASFFYRRRLYIPDKAFFITRKVVRISLLLISLLLIMAIWGIPTSPILLLIAIVAILAIVAFKDAAPNLFASFQLAASQGVKLGDYVILEGGEGGYVTAMSWNQTRLKATDGSTILVPNDVMVKRKVINYGRPLKKAGQPFYFKDGKLKKPVLTASYTAHDLREFVEALRKISPSSLHFHLVESKSRLSRDSNDFSIWLEKELKEPELAAEVAGVDPSGSTPEELRSRLILIVEKRIK